MFPSGPESKPQASERGRYTEEHAGSKAAGAWEAVAPLGRATSPSQVPGGSWRRRTEASSHPWLTAGEGSETQEIQVMAGTW